jgi:hypothetical protein
MTPSDLFLQAHGCRWGIPREMHWTVRGAHVVDYWNGFGRWYRSVQLPGYVHSMPMSFGGIIQT